jgi:ABC-type nitrate/sulfonate/bicarbonate transport system substrate-binding protein
MGATEAGLLLQEQGRGRVLMGVEKYAPQFITQVVTSRQPYIQQHPDMVERFLKGMFASIAFVKANKDASDAIAQRVLNQSPTVMSKTYDAEVGMLSDDGTFDPAAIKVLKDSFVDLGTLPDRPADSQLFTTQFVPVKP